MAQTNIRPRARSRRSNRPLAPRPLELTAASRKRSGIPYEIEEPKSKRQKMNPVEKEGSTSAILGQGSSHETAQAAQEQNVMQSKSIQGRHKSGPPKSVEGEMATLAAEKPRFRKVLSQLNFDEIAPLASRTRQRIEYHEKGRPVRRVRCRVSPRAANGSFNLVFIISFDDGVYWGLKIPANGHRDCFDDTAAHALKSEALTMQTIQRDTTIPLPTIYGFDNTMDNELGCPYIMMEWLRGESLWKVWFDKKSSPTRLEQVRLRALQTIAAAIVQLNGYRSDYSGAWRFDEGLNPVDVGGAKVVDMWTTSEETNEEEQDDLLVKKDPSPDPLDALLFMLHRRGMKSQCNARGRGIDMSLKLFTEWARERALGEEPEFVLAHPDFDIQNILVDRDGALCGILDWDGVAFVPHCVGCLKYPMFLTRDWSLDDYNFDINTRGKKWADGHIENSPEELTRYRTMYAQFVEAAFSTGFWSRRTVKAYGDVTRGSALTASLAMADQYPQCIEGIMKCIYNGIDGIPLDGSADAGASNNLCNGMGGISANGRGQSEAELGTVRLGEGTASTEEYCNSNNENERHQEDNSGEDCCDNEPEDHHAGKPKVDASHIDQVDDGSIGMECKRCKIEKAQLSLDAQMNTVVAFPESDRSLTPLDDCNNMSVGEVGIEAPDLSRKVKVARYLCGLAERGCRKAAEAVRKIPNPGSKAKSARAVEEGSPCTGSVQIEKNSAPSKSQKCRAAKYLCGFDPHKLLGITDIWCHGSAETKPSATKSDDEKPRNEKMEIKPRNGQASTDFGARVDPAIISPNIEHRNGCPKRMMKRSDLPAAGREKGDQAPKSTRQIWAGIAAKVEDAGNSAAAVEEHQDEIAAWIIEKLQQVEKRSNTAKVAQEAERGAKALGGARDRSRGNDGAEQEGTAPPFVADRLDKKRRLMDMLNVEQPRGTKTNGNVAEYVDADIVQMTAAIITAKRLESVTRVAAAPRDMASTMEKPEGEARGDRHVAKGWLFDTDEDREVASNDVYHEPIDKGGFNMDDICVALGNGALDAGRYYRLRLRFNLMFDDLLAKV
ncbi:hypothetical protein N7G274_009531 [Stereocaulon virgatum]|uniref:Aminoglycoside phosphotransferase domain-containing protein n=1 Tax=Stereocaulon virgatum TaxID=373712 RepID=A0ABR3ZYP0_9LECA